MILTAEEIRLILDALQKVYGFGYSNEPGVGPLQAKLGIMLEAKLRAAKAGGRE